MPAPAPTSIAPSDASGLVPNVSRDLVYPEVRVAARLHGANLSQLLRFVSHEIGNDPYDGALRGARGTLLAGAGSAADKALLLRDLVRLSDPAAQVRFAIGRLPPAEAQELASAALAERAFAEAPEPTASYRRRGHRLTSTSHSTGNVGLSSIVSPRCGPLRLTTSRSKAPRSTPHSERLASRSDPCWSDVRS